MDVLQDIETFGYDIAEDVKNTFAPVWTNYISPLLKAVEPTVLNDLITLIDSEAGLIIEAGVDVATGSPVGSLLGNVLTTALNQGKTDILTIKAPVINALIAAKTVAISATAKAA